VNAIQQISLKLQLGIDPVSKIEPEQLLEQWQAFRSRKCRAANLNRQNNQQCISSKSKVTVDSSSGSNRNQLDKIACVRLAELKRCCRMGRVAPQLLSIECRFHVPFTHLR